MTEAEEEGEGGGGGRGDGTGSRRGEEMGVTSHLSSWLESRMPTFCLKALIELQGCSKGVLFLGTRAPREREGIIDSQEATRKH